MQLLSLAVASDRPRKGLSPSITQPCPTHLQLVISAAAESLLGTFEIQVGEGTLVGFVISRSLSGGRLPLGPLTLDFSTIPETRRLLTVAGVRLEAATARELSREMEISFSRATLDGAVLAERTDGSTTSVTVRGRQVLSGNIKSSNPRTVGDLQFETLDALLVRNGSLPLEWQFRGPATHFGIRYDIGTPGPKNPQVSIGGINGQVLRIAGIPGLDTPPAFAAPPRIEVAGLTFDLSRLTEKSQDFQSRCFHYLHLRVAGLHREDWWYGTLLECGSPLQG